MAWSPPAHNAGIVWVSAPGDYATFNSNHTPDGTQFTRIADSGNEVAGVFCPECGVRIYHVLKSVQDVLALKPGTLDDTSWLRPEHFIWMKSAQGWVPVPDGVRALEGQT
jgi:hypothetical protein